jgi:hypothetical protein
MTRTLATNYKKRFTGVSLALAGSMSLTAQTVLIDFGNNTSFRGVSVVNPDLNGNHWNSFQPGFFYSNLIDVNNNATTIDFGFSTPVGTDSYNGPAGATSIPPTPTEIAATDINAVALGNLGIKEAAFDFAAGVGVRFEIQQLDPSKLYNLTFFGSHKFNSDAATVYSIFSDNTYSTLVASGSLNVYQPGSPWLHNRDTVLTLNNIAPQTGNILYVQFTGAQGGDGYLNSMRITAVPEPAAASLLGLALAALLAVKRNNKG